MAATDIFGRARNALVETLRGQGIVRSPGVDAALRATPREAFLAPGTAPEDAYLDAPLPIGGGQTVSAPHMVAMMCEALDVRPGHRVLEVGGGSGYHAAVLAHLASPGGRVDSVEYRADLADAAARRLAPLHLPVEMHVGDGSEGFAARAPFDRISVAAAAPALPPPLLDQLAPGGALVIPVGSRSAQTLLRVRRDEAGDLLPPEPLVGCMFVPLLGRHGFEEAHEGTSL